MIQLDEDALICDLAETYQIYSYRSLPVRLVATLSAGLRDNSRIKLKAVESSIDLETIILATIADNLTMLRMSLTTKEKAKPFLFTNALLGESKKDKAASFRTAEEFEATLRDIRGE